jgi:hypothetical protein
MRGLLAATAVLGVVAIGGLPVLALTLADAETDRQVSAARPPGPPPWAHGQGKPDQDDEPGDDDKAGKGRDKDGAGPPGWARHGDSVPPGWAKNHAGRSPHGWAVREWAHCVADAAADLDSGEKLDPEAACGARPTPPGALRR